MGAAKKAGVLTLYEVLGVSQQASPAEIKFAYRDAVKTHHPDVGGDAREFEKVQRAYFVLSDPDRRALYDQTGVEDDAPAGTEQQLAHDLIAALVAQFITTDDDLAKIDVVAICNTKIKEQKAFHKSNTKQLEKLLHRVESLQERLCRKDGGEGLLLTLLFDRDQNIRASIVKERRKLRVADRALVVLEDYVYRTDPSPLDEDKIWAALKGKGS